MRDKPIIMSAPMVRATIREIKQPGTGKIETRRLLTPRNTRFNGYPWPAWAKTAKWDWDEAWVDPGPSPAGNPGPYLHLPYAGDEGDWVGTRHRIYPMYWPGLKLWVRETWKPHSLYAHLKPRDVPPSAVFYKADERYAPSGTPWVPSIHMPRWASLITLTVTEVRVERLQEITEEGARAEGIDGYASTTSADGGARNIGEGPRLPAFVDLWNGLHSSGAWDANPWVAVIRFVPKLANIDAETPDA
jgi:hypothetical protein